MTVIKADMISDHVIRKDMLPLSFLKKSSYTGSKRSLNYKLAKTEVPVSDNPPAEGEEPEKKTVLRVYSWFGPNEFDTTDPELISSTDVEFSDAGIDEAIRILNEKLEEEKKSL